MTDANFYGINGEIYRGVASNNLVVAVREFDGTDFSTSNPLVYKIGNTPRVLSNFLRVDVNAGTNTFNAGSSELATKEIDYFVYLGWRASNSSIFLLVSRIPYATTYGDFSTTATNEKYGAYSGVAPASTDSVVNIGRFNATNSGTASYNWSVPATSVIINHPIFDTRWLDYTPTRANVTAGSGSSSKDKYYVSGRNVSVVNEFTFGTSGASVGGAVTLTTPFGFYIPSINAIGVAVFRDPGSAQYAGQIYEAGGSAVQLMTLKVDGTYATQVAMNTNVPFTWSNSDFFGLTYSYGL